MTRGVRGPSVSSPTATHRCLPMRRFPPTATPPSSSASRTCTSSRGGSHDPAHQTVRKLSLEFPKPPSFDKPIGPRPTPRHFETRAPPSPRSGRVGPDVCSVRLRIFGDRGRLRLPRVTRQAPPRGRRSAVPANRHPPKRALLRLRFHPFTRTKRRFLDHTRQEKERLRGDDGRG